LEVLRSENNGGGREQDNDSKMEPSHGQLLWMELRHRLLFDGNAVPSQFPDANWQRAKDLGSR
jgi:hypothetical protein